MAETPKAKAASGDALVARAIGKALWERDFKKSNPSATAADKRAAWDGAKGEYVRAGRFVQAKLARAGFTITGQAGGAND